MDSAPWGEYVALLRREEDVKQGEFARRALGRESLQGKISRWEGGGSPPTRAADVAAFAGNLGRNPLEAFVAAGMLGIDEAGRGLGMPERFLLRSLGIGSRDSDRLLEACGEELAEEELSDLSTTTDLATAADEDVSIAREQESMNET